ncbi:MAG: ATP-binding protein, partial [Candidatus Thermoplasmatota archaeon]|nr:ATP-binding protein [Candidatus Thermoplasmatota archaeon]
AKSEFLANMSHEIRTPMTVVVSVLEQLGMEELGAEPRKLLQMAEASAESLLALLNDLLDFSRIEARKVKLHPEPFALRERLAQLVAMMRPQAEKKGLTLTLEAHPELPATLLGDPDRLGQVLLNLLSNAVKFTERGRVTLRVEPCAEGQHSLRFTVRDTGIGIPPEQQDHLFQSFGQLDSSRTKRYGGTGLGLAISKGLVELMGGEMQVESAPGRGSTFAFRLPLSQAEDSAPPAAAAATAPSPAGDAAPLRILLVEDDDQVREILASLLRRRPEWTTLTAAGAEEGLHIARDQDPDLILMDVQMPGMDGLTATRQLRAQGCQVPIIALTAYARQEDQERCLAAGMTGFLTKPVKRQ